VRKARIIAGACVLALSACAVPPAPQAQADISPTAVRTAWLGKGRYVWQPLVTATDYTTVRRVKLAKKDATTNVAAKDATTNVAAVPRVLACDLAGFNQGCATY
jgi:hypothetical protein